MMVSKTSVLFLCTHNSARSQMAEGILRSMHGDRYDVYSAGIEPTKVHPYAVNVMKEIGIDISDHRAKNIEEFRGKTFDYVVTVCDHAKEACPFFPGKQVLHQGFEDPTLFSGDVEVSLQVFRRLRDEIRMWIDETFR